MGIMVAGIGRRLISFGLVLLVLAGTAWIIWTQFSDSSPNLQSVYEDLDVAVEDLRLVQGGKGQRTWELIARHSRYIRDESRIEFDQPRITFYKHDESGPIKARAPRGEYLQDQGIARLWPQVTATYGQTTVHSQRMLFDQKDQEITFESQVTINHPQVNATSNTAVIDLQENQLILTGDVEVEIDDADIGSNP
jgi:LPS export ABC transporter protein LptC